MASIISFVFLVLVFFKLTACDHCDRCHSYTANPTGEGYLPGFNFTTLFVDSLLNCVFSCLSRTFCLCASMNFYSVPTVEGLHLCELNNETRKSSNASLIARDGFQHFDLMPRVKVSKTQFYDQ